MLVIREKTRKTGPFTEKSNCNGVMVMSQQIGGKGCFYRYTSSLGMTPTRCCSVEQQGSPSPIRWRFVDGENVAAFNNNISRQGRRG